MEGRVYERGREEGSMLLCVADRLGVILSRRSAAKDPAIESGGGNRNDF
jgi:hypothetical protein